jgi:tryptophan-rich sensory protein
VALWLFGAQLVVNALWSWTFFAWRLGAVAMATVLLLLVLVAATRWQARRHDRLAAALLFPYLLWVGFASVLTATLWRLNPGLLG